MTEFFSVLSPELSHMSFEDILKLQNKVGTKVYNEVAYGSNKNTETRKKKRLNKNRWTVSASNYRQLLCLQHLFVLDFNSVCLCFQAGGNFSQETSSIPPSGRRCQETSE